MYLLSWCGYIQYTYIFPTELFCERAVLSRKVHRVRQGTCPSHADGNKDGASFPSGDAMSGGTLGGVLIVLMQSWWPIFIPVWVGIGRQFFFCHWFLDTFFGGLLGLTSAYFMNNVFYSSYRDISDLQMVIIAPLLLLSKIYIKLGINVFDPTNKK